MEEQLRMCDRATPPPRYVTHTPVLFDVWLTWYESLEPRVDLPEQTPKMAPFGAEVAPDFVKFQFENLEEFFNHYQEMTEEVD